MACAKLWPDWIIIFYITNAVSSYQSMTFNIFNDCHLGYLNFKIYSPIKFCQGSRPCISMILKKLGSFNSHVVYEISRSHSPKEFFIALAIRLLLKSNTVIFLRNLDDRLINLVWNHWNGFQESRFTGCNLLSKNKLWIRAWICKSDIINLFLYFVDRLHITVLFLIFR